MTENRENILLCWYDHFLTPCCFAAVTSLPLWTSWQILKHCDSCCEFPVMSEWSCKEHLHKRCLWMTKSHHFNIMMELCPVWKTLKWSQNTHTHTHWSDYVTEAERVVRRGQQYECKHQWPQSDLIPTMPLSCFSRLNVFIQYCQNTVTSNE